MRKLFLTTVALLAFCIPALASDEIPKSSLHKEDFVCPTSRQITSEEYDKTFKKPEDTFVRFMYNDLDKKSQGHVIGYYMYKTKTLVTVRIVMKDADDPSQGIKEACVLSEGYYPKGAAELLNEENARLIKYIMDHIKDK